MSASEKPLPPRRFRSMASFVTSSPCLKAGASRFNGGDTTLPPRRLRPSPVQNVQRGIVVPSEDETASRARVRPHPELLRDDGAAPGAVLRRSPWPHLGEQSSSIFRFLLQRRDEPRPRGVRDAPMQRTASVAVLDHHSLDVEVLDPDGSEALDGPPGRLETEVPAPIPDALPETAKDPTGLPSTVRPLDLPADRSLSVDD